MLKYMVDVFQSLAMRNAIVLELIVFFQVKVA